MYRTNAELEQKQKKDRARGLAIVVVTIFVFLGLSFVGCGRGLFASEDTAIRTLEAQGYSNIQIVEKAWFAVGWRGCDDSDAARFTARATNAAGKTVEVYVCTGALLKGGTIRGK